MLCLQRLLSLPAPLVAILFLPTVSDVQAAHFNLQPHEKYFPEHEDQLRSQWEVQQKLGLHVPIGMRKMSNDEGEKFILEYWQFEPSVDNLLPIHINPHDMRGRPSVDTIARHSTGNDSVAGLLPALHLHMDVEEKGFSRWFRRNLFERDFKCPSGTADCASIGQPDSCCQNGETCINVQNSPLGPVGCCPAGQTCNGGVASCNTAQGYTSCPGSANGGCCIPGYTCQGVGCVAAGTQVMTTSLPTSTVTAGVTPAANIPPSASTIVVTAFVTGSAPQPTIQTVTTTVVVIPSTSAQPTTVVQTITLSSSSATALVQGALTCTTGYQSCPASLGGGCCPTNRACGSPSCPPLPGATSDATTAAVAPVRPTSASDDTSSTTTTTDVTAVAANPTTSSSIASGCPTGFYMCSAYFMGGCCQVGRNCDTTSCPPSATVGVVTSNSLTIVAGTPPSGAAAAQGTCNSGWQSCAASDGGGCCPSGFVCGASCTATVSGAGNVGKVAPSSGTRNQLIGLGFMISGIAAGIAMVIL